MRNYTILLFTLIILNLISCKDSSKKEIKNGLIELTLEMPDKILDYEVKILFEPYTDMLYENYDDIDNPYYNECLGKATIKFSKGSNSFIEENEMFSLEFEKGGIIVDEFKQTLKDIDVKKIKLDSLVKNFLIRDVNFDGNKDILFVLNKIGQRGCSGYAVYLNRIDKFNNNQELFTITNEAPFKDLDEFSIIDSLRQEIIIYSSGGACASSYDYYRLYSTENTNTEYLLKYKSVEYESNHYTNECYENTFEFDVNKNNKKLISRKIIKN